MIQAYRGLDVYDIFVEEVDGAIGGGGVGAHLESDESDKEYVDHGIPSESDDSDFKNGVSFLCNHNGDAYESDGEDSDEVGYYEEVDSDDEVRYRKSPYPKYDRNSARPFFETTMTFTSMKEVRDAIRKHVIVERRDLRWVKNDPTQNHIEHVCPEHYKNKFVTPTVIATHYKDRIKSNPRWKNRDMRQTVREDFGCEVMVMQCSRAKAKVLRTTFESYKSEYALLRSYAEELLRVNPGIPCAHAITCIISEGNDPEKYISEWYAIKKY
ncbi:hypothetical protein LINPERPRIM_LOCUS22673 [Linum perenne]